MGSPDLHATFIPLSFIFLIVLQMYSFWYLIFIRHLNFSFCTLIHIEDGYSFGKPKSDSRIAYHVRNMVLYRIRLILVWVRVDPRSKFFGITYFVFCITFLYFVFAFDVYCIFIVLSLCIWFSVVDEILVAFSSCYFLLSSNSLA